ncbi:NADH dehydrogenase [ubiquinone] flavoprotein 3, mitochondrial isoform X2 [Alligator sinensis]|uniref:NADH dehydrogenase [ubiquinone] flavoprotein 3, mitochondrial isoform X2 n=1 Tax=Alligator sinensis TaxID=38654 RepID=A0A3Q0FHY8_ALLSI|nr:NADH dehydrogenase [ubiquinone] flavoprotein 3, mitochondrial isoform X2 [Alligator sinensis]
MRKPHAGPGPAAMAQSTPLPLLLLKTLQLEVWGQQGLVPSVSLCTKSGGSAKGPAKNMAPQESTKLLTTKTTVEFPKKLSPSSHPPPANKEIKTAAASAPEEFDNSTYKNLQHHEYHIYTFVDFDVYLSKFRQPQPSSGRISPWQ